MWLLSHLVHWTCVATSHGETSACPTELQQAVARAAPHRLLALSLRKFHTIWGLGSPRSRVLRHRRAPRECMVDETGREPPRCVADLLRVREACQSERGRREPCLSCTSAPTLSFLVVTFRLPQCDDRGIASSGHSVRSQRCSTNCRASACSVTPDVVRAFEPLGAKAS
jgi:hypothetical protein